MTHLELIWKGTNMWSQSFKKNISQERRTERTEDICQEDLLRTPRATSILLSCSFNPTQKDKFNATDKQSG